MKLRIISGALKGRTITVPEKDMAFRPTLERTRQSIADLIAPRCVGAVAADLFAGSGAFGFEMISRGAKRVDFVENDRGRAKVMADHAEKFGVLSQCRIMRIDAGVFLRSCSERYDIVFLDPPYDTTVPDDLVAAVLKILLPGGMLLYQRRKPSRNEAGSRTAIARPFETKPFGDTVVEIYKQSREE